MRLKKDSTTKILRFSVCWARCSNASFFLVPVVAIRVNNLPFLSLSGSQLSKSLILN